MPPLPSDAQRLLLGLARGALFEAVVHGRLASLPEPAGALAEPRGAFVTLHRRGRLRGCVGWVDPVKPLAQTVAWCAYAAAREDSRFSPVEPAELQELDIEISVLSPLRRVPPEEINPLEHGLRVALGGAQAVYLPQVARRFAWSRERLLQETCRKALLPADAWKDPAACLEIFTVEVLAEGKEAGRAKEEQAVNEEAQE